MRFFILFALTVSSLTLSIQSTLASVPPTRFELDRAAQKEFLDMQFFKNGLGMHISPDLIETVSVAEYYTKKTGKDFPILKHRYGITQINARSVGLFKVDYEGMKVGVLGCVACHSSKAAGQFIIGIGNKNIDVGQIGEDAFLGQTAWKVLRPEILKSEAYKKVQNSAIGFTRELKDPLRRNLTQGLVPTSVIRKWFYRMAGEPYPTDMPRGAVKVPHLFGYAEKRKVGQFADGGGNGELPGWGIAVELAAGQTAENVRLYVDRLEHAENLLGDFLPPAYPFAIDTQKSARGKNLFDAKCAGCHGTHARDTDGLPIYEKPKLVSWSVVKTDHDRLEKLDDHFLSLIEKSPLSDIIAQTGNREKYVAPRLHAIWARFPYLHNGSVPTLYDLLSPASERPKYFSLRNAGERERFDEKNLGLQVRGTFAVVSKPKKQRRDTYDTTLVGQFNSGHEFQTSLSDAEKFDLIEYLKTL